MKRDFKILAIGNSFSQDCTVYLHRLSGLYARNLYIGGCSLERHARNIAGNLAEYEFQKDGVPEKETRVSINSVLGEGWDAVTVQQCSVLSGMQDTYEPYLGQVIAAVRAACPSAEIIFHQTWAHVKGSPSPEFYDSYRGDTAFMTERIVAVSEKAATDHNLRMIRTGEAVAFLRETELFGDLCRDGFHLNVCGRYAGAFVWTKFFGVAPSRFVPDGADPATISRIAECLDGFLADKR